ncbi:hypothetical protein ACJX0J_027545, partial [Zea mays]
GKYHMILTWFYTKIGEKIGWTEFGVLFGAVLWLICQRWRPQPYVGSGLFLKSTICYTNLTWFYTKIGEKIGWTEFGVLFGAVLWLICQRWRPQPYVGSGLFLKSTICYTKVVFSLTINIHFHIITSKVSGNIFKLAQLGHGLDS